MPTQSTLDKQKVPTVPVVVSLPKDRSLLKRYVKQKPAHKVGRVVWSGGTKHGSFPKEK